MSHFSPEKTVLPKEAPSAKASFDRLSFRKPGDSSAKLRKDQLQRRIEELTGKEEKLKRKLSDMQSKYCASTAAEVDESFTQITMKMRDMKQETRDLCDRVGKQVTETMEALQQAIPQHPAANAESGQASESIKKKEKVLSQRQRDCDIARLNDMILDHDLKELESKIVSAREYQQKIEKHLQECSSEGWKGASDRFNDITNTDYDTYSLDRGLLPENLLKKGAQTQVANIAAKVQSSSPAANKKDGAREHIEQHARPEATNIRSGSRENMSIDDSKRLEADKTELARWQQPQASQSEELEGKMTKHPALSEAVQYYREGDEDKKHLNERDRSQKEEFNRSDSEATWEGMPHPSPDEGQALMNMMKEQMMNQLQAQHQEEKKMMMKQANQEIENLQRKLDQKYVEREKNKKKWDKGNDEVMRLQQELEQIHQTESEQSIHDAKSEPDQKWKLKKREDLELQVKNLERENERELALEAVREESVNKPSSRPRPLFLSANFSRPSYRYNALEKDPDMETNTEKIHLQSLSSVIDKVEALEKGIRGIRSLNEDIESVADLRFVLERELDLESRWLDTRARQLTASVATDDSPAQGRKDHFANSLPEEFYKSYSPLEKGQMRLLVLWPAPEHYPLLCTLETSTMEQTSSNLQYAALSYFWGPDICNGRLYLVTQDNPARNVDSDTWGSTARHALRIPIRDNLFRALLRLRRQDSPICLWVDVMCINQTDATEKTQQLEQMINIYRNAKNVCVWLGESDNEGRSDEAMDFIKAIMDFAVLDRYAQDTQQAEKWNGLAELMRDRWFSRRWVVQEISLAREATILCGSKMVRWSDFADAVSLLASNQDTIRNLFSYSDWRDGPNTLGDVRSFGAHILLEATSKLFRRTPEGEITRPIKGLQFLVTSLKTFDVTDPKDLIYSLASIASDTPQGCGIYSSGKRGITQLDVDYKKSREKVYRDFTKFCIVSSKSLDILCRPWAKPVPESATIDGTTASLPSWIPLLSQSEFGAPDDVYSGRKNGESLVGPVEQPHYSASGEEEYNIELVDVKWESLQFLPVNGFKLAKIGKVSSRISGGVILQDSLKMGGWNGINEETSSVPDEIWRTLVADRDPDGQIPPTWYQRACLRCLEIADNFNNGDINIGELLGGKSELIRKYLNRVRNVTLNRRFFKASTENETRTTNGGNPLTTAKQKPKSGNQGAYPNGSTSHDDQKVTQTESAQLFGLGPPDMSEDDYVCILIGCSVPVILREQDGYILMMQFGYRLCFHQIPRWADEYINYESLKEELKTATADYRSVQNGKSPNATMRFP
ncbi:heterokaryon incompatibility protein-domain-containing protein [Nemania sp. FL0916]|nr:heterokaryon incompatibility protein-domain-containing protein [Nemania sp. FL0916]